ncbi:hypothetical protein EOA13_00405 [Mesorhizobium sp. M7A.F.Ca.US.011.01.1.1]|uniref:CBS domain-containing protein n=1 Tax=Mesorhizobium sp. M7A.F.Ca.US.011.01.1.1 TaxID=2496741 RepID=UPI000FCBE844|nr:CBS domain-containing protein [Mesorhizobium sp. M7A.F.Ca.US.011.01.1.1]RUX32604.1 hypothetical protein EOA13_00405 [Mesorhizobium sp. M7A.F.Ca.US.011.01.1.1]
MNDANESFIRLFEEIAREVNRRAGTPTLHSVEIEKASERDGFVKKNRALLVYIRDVRNALQHPKHRSKGDAIRISEPFLKEVQDLLNHLRNPPTANSVGVPRREIRTASLNDQLGELANEMKKHGFSHVPILDRHDAVIGVFNEAAMFDHLWAEPETIVSRQMLISDILPSCRLDAKRMEIFRFVGPRTPLDDLVEMSFPSNRP